MEISQRSQGEITILDIVGEIDLYNAPELEVTVRKLITEKKIKILINMSQVPFIDSNGLAKLIFTQRELKKVSGSLKLAALSPAILKIFEATKLDKVLSVFASEEDALQAF